MYLPFSSLVVLANVVVGIVGIVGVVTVDVELDKWDVSALVLLVNVAVGTVGIVTVDVELDKWGVELVVDNNIVVDVELLLVGDIVVGHPGIYQISN